MKKVLVFDMDGTIVDFYNVEGWLERLKQEDTFPYDRANAMYDMREMRKVLIDLKLNGWTIAVTTWSSLTGSKEFHDRIAIAKTKWLKAFKFPYDELHIVPYGTPKHSVTKGDIQILFDDNIEVIKEWDEVHQISVNATSQNILNVLKMMLL